MLWGKKLMGWVKIIGLLNINLMINSLRCISWSKISSNHNKFDEFISNFYYFSICYSFLKLIFSYSQTKKIKTKFYSTKINYQFWYQNDDFTIHNINLIQFKQVICISLNRRRQFNKSDGAGLIRKQSGYNGF